MPIWNARVSLGLQSQLRIESTGEHNRVRIDTGPSWVEVVFTDVRRADLQSIMDACERGIEELNREARARGDNK